MTRPLTQAEQTALLSHDLQIRLPQEFPGLRIFRANVGTAIPIGIVKQAIGMIERGDISAAIAILRRRPVSFGTEGSADFIGWTGTGVFYGVEVKQGSDRLSEAQVVWREALLKAGGIYVEFREIEAGIAEFRRQVDAESIAARIADKEKT